MNSFNKQTSFLVIILSFLLAATILNAQSIKTPFNTNEIVEQVSQYNNLTGSREGEFLIDTNVVYGPDTSAQCNPSIAFDGTNYLVVWQDNRSDQYYDIYGTRVNQAGIVLDTAGIAIAATADYQYNPSVAFDGTNYLVVWENQYDWLDTDIYGARVDQSGIVLDTAGIAIAVTEDYQMYPSVAFDGTNYFVVWENQYDWLNSDIYSARVNQAGIVLDTAGIVIAATADDQSDPSVAFDGTNYLVVWQDYCSGQHYDIYGARVNQSGLVLDTAGIAISTDGNDQEFPSIAFDNTNYLVVWQDCRNTSNPDIYGARVDQSGMVFDPTGIAISTAPGRQKFPSIAFDNTNYLVVWDDDRRGEPDIFSARISQSGIVLDPDGNAISIAQDDQYEPSVAFDGTNYLVVWENQYDWFNADIYGTRVDQAGTVLDTTEIVIATLIDVLYYYEQYNPSVIFGNTNYLVVWHEDRGGPWDYAFDIYSARVDQSGVVLDTAMIAISTASSDQIFPSVAFDGINYLVVWQDHRSGPYDIYGTRMDQSGVVLDTAGIAICTAGGSQWYPSVAFDGTNYLVVWQDRRSGSYDIFGARVDQSGIVLDPDGIVIAATVDDQYDPSVAFDNTNYLVVWSQSYDIYGTRVDQSGNVLDTAGIAICTAGGSQWSHSIAFDGTNYLVVWQDHRSGPYDIYGARMDQSGVVLDTTGIAICTSGGPQVYPSVTFDDTNYLVVWEDIGSGWDIYGAKVSSAGVVINSYAIAVQPGQQKTPALAHGTADSVLITYSGWTDSINGQPANTMRIWGKLYPFVGIEENALCPVPDSRHLLQVYPNPIHKQCNIKYILPQAANINISMFDVAGRLIKEIINENQNVGIYHKVFDMKDLPQGIYFITLNTDDYSDAKKVIFIK